MQLAENTFDTEQKFFYENGYHTTSTVDRMGKFLAHWELYKRIIDLPGHIIECGVFKGNSLIRFAAFRDLQESPFSRKIIGFDTFADFPPTEFKEDQKYLEGFLQETGGKSITLEDLEAIFSYKQQHNIHLVKGDIRKTVPRYCRENPHLKIALLHLDTDVYEPAVTVLEHFFTRIVEGGLLVLDDYGTFPGETKAVDDFFQNQNLEIKKLPISHIPSYVVKK